MTRVDSRPLESAAPGMMANIQSEVAAENRPLLEFIVRNAKYLIAIIVLLLAALCGTAIYNYVQGGQREDTLTEIARIMATPPSAAQLEELDKLAGSAPASMRTAIAVAEVRSALAQNLPARAEQAYALVAKSGFDTPLGLAAAINQAGILMSEEKYAEGVRILQGLLPRLTPQTGVQAKMMLAEGAARAGQYDLAARTFDELAATALVAPIDKDYCTTRARDLRAMAEAEKADGEKAGETKEAN